MNVVKEIQRINERELASGSKGSWHDQYKDSAHVFIGGLHNGLTEGDVVTIFSQYGEVVDINMPRDKETGKSRGFAFLMYEDQRSTILAVDNLNGAKVLDRTLRVDHTVYEQRGKKNADGEWEEPEAPSYNAAPQLARDEAGSGDSDVESILSELDIDPEDPMRDWLLSKFKDEKGKSKSKKSKKHEGETPEERRARKERKRAKREAKAKKQEEEKERSVPSKRRRGDSMSVSPPPNKSSSHRSESQDRKRDGDYGRGKGDSYDRRREGDYDRRRDDDYGRRRDRDPDQRTGRDSGRNRDGERD